MSTQRKYLSPPHVLLRVIALSFANFNLFAHAALVSSGSFGSIFLLFILLLVVVRSEQALEERRGALLLIFRLWTDSSGAM